MAVVHITASLDDDISMRLEQADQLLSGRHRLAGEDAAFGLADEAFDEWQIMPDLAAPEFGFDRSAGGQALGDVAERGHGGARGRDQLPV